LKPRQALPLCLLPIFAAIFVYSVTWAFVWDEGFHLVAAQLIAGGKTPYIDFCFHQTPLNAYLNAGIMLLFGENWHVVHLFSTLYLCVAIWLAADYVLVRLPSNMWPFSSSLATAALLGLNVVVVQYACAGQAYAICMMLLTASFRFATGAIHKSSTWFALMAGMLAGGAICSSMLTAPAPLVLLLWLWFRNRAGSRLWKTAVYLFGCAIPFSPVIWLYIRAPRQTLFNVVQYQALFRRVNWGDATLRDFETLSGFLASPDALILAALGIAAVLFLRSWNEPRRDEFYLAAAIAVALIVFIACAHPTFERYFILAVPFLSILGGLGLWVLGSRLATPEHSLAPATILLTLTALIWGRGLFDERDDEHWSDYEEVAAKVAEVTPINARLYADELVFFLLKRTPTEGMAFSYAERLDLPAAQEQLYHIISLTKLKQQVKAGQFATMQTCRQGVLDDVQPEKSFKHHEEPADCDVFWGPK
jgi:4-amino-4-deoxy-L-arabinose transferase-like glycosyltransferase